MSGLENRLRIARARANVPSNTPRVRVVERRGAPLLVRHASTIATPANHLLGDDPSGMQSAQEFAQLLERSDAFTEHLVSLLQPIPDLRDDARGLAGRRAAHLALEHGAAV